MCFLAHANGRQRPGSSGRSSHVESTSNSNVCSSPLAVRSFRRTVAVHQPYSSFHQYSMRAPSGSSCSFADCPPPTGMSMGVNPAVAIDVNI